MGFSFLSWNVEHFRDNPNLAARSARIAAHIRAQDPDIFGLFEVETVDVVSLMQNEFPNYTFGITDGPRASISPSTPAAASLPPAPTTRTEKPYTGVPTDTTSRPAKRFVSGRRPGGANDTASAASDNP